MKSTGASGNALHTQASILINEDGHKRFLNQGSRKKILKDEAGICFPFLFS
jgi:hypothetical protein